MFASLYIFLYLLFRRNGRRRRRRFLVRGARKGRRSPLAFEGIPLASAQSTHLKEIVTLFIGMKRLAEMMRAELVCTFSRRQYGGEAGKRPSSRRSNKRLPYSIRRVSASDACSRCDGYVPSRLFARASGPIPLTRKPFPSPPVLVVFAIRMRCAANLNVSPSHRCMRSRLHLCGKERRQERG